MAPGLTTVHTRSAPPTPWPAVPPPRPTKCTVHRTFCEKQLPEAAWEAVTKGSSGGHVPQASLPCPAYTEVITFTPTAAGETRLPGESSPGSTTRHGLLIKGSRKHLPRSLGMPLASPHLPFTQISLVSMCCSKQAGPVWTKEVYSVISWIKRGLESPKDPSFLEMLSRSVGKELPPAWL